MSKLILLITHEIADTEVSMYSQPVCIFLCVKREKGRVIMIVSPDLVLIIFKVKPINPVFPKRKKKSAPAGNRTQVASLTGENYTTQPPNQMVDLQFNGTYSTNLSYPEVLLWDIVGVISTFGEFQRNSVVSFDPPDQPI